MNNNILTLDKKKYHKACIVSSSSSIISMLIAGVAFITTVRASAQNADAIYHGGTIITVNDAANTAEAIAVKDGRILAVGSKVDVLQKKGDATKLIDLGGKTLIPGFIDPHSHIAAYEFAWGLPVLNPPPIGDVEKIADIITKLKDYIASKKLAPGTLVIGTGYDDSLLKERRHPIRKELDQVSSEHPVLIVHTSGHLISANTAALKLVGYDKATPDPNGGVIRRDSKGEPDGVCEELAAMPFLLIIKPHSMVQQLKNFDDIQAYYASLGVTTAQDGISMPNDIALLKEAARQKRLIIDVVSYPRWDIFNDVLSGQRKLDIEYHPPIHACESMSGEDQIAVEPVIKDSTKTQVGIYQNRLKFAGIKITADGSPQGKTAFLTEPYVHAPEGQKKDYRGYSTVTQEELDRWFDAAYQNDLQLIVHCNGDAAADMMILAARKAQSKHGRKDLRPVMIHAQMIRHDQVDAMAELGIVPSFFTAHTYYWGDWHINETVGRNRAFGMSPCAYALKKGLRFTNHTDASIVPPNHLDAMWTAVNRVSRTAVVVGPDERISALDALKAVTINAAYQYFEEKKKGSLEIGKLADLVILDKDPLTVPPMTIKDIKVLETIKEGKTIYQSH
jgi:predicted amidohydrolase YtcJ